MQLHTEAKENVCVYRNTVCMSNVQRAVAQAHQGECVSSEAGSLGDAQWLCARRTDGRTDGRKYGRTDEQTDEQTDERDGNAPWASEVHAASAS